MEIRPTHTHEASLWLGFTHICSPSIHTKTHALQLRKKTFSFPYSFFFKQQLLEIIFKSLHTVFQSLALATGVPKG